MLSLVSYQIIKSTKNTSKEITKAEKNMVNDLDYNGIEFPVSKKDFRKIKKKK